MGSTFKVFMKIVINMVVDLLYQKRYRLAEKIHNFINTETKHFINIEKWGLSQYNPQLSGQITYSPAIMVITP